MLVMVVVVQEGGCGAGGCTRCSSGAKTGAGGSGDWWAAWGHQLVLVGNGEDGDGERMLVLVPGISWF